MLRHKQSDIRSSAPVRLASRTLLESLEKAKIEITMQHMEMALSLLVQRKKENIDDDLMKEMIDKVLSKFNGELDDSESEDKTVCGPREEQGVEDYFSICK